MTWKKLSPSNNLSLDSRVIEKGTAIKRIVNLKSEKLEKLLKAEELSQIAD